MFENRQIQREIGTGSDLNYIRGSRRWYASQLSEFMGNPGIQQIAVASVGWHGPYAFFVGMITLPACPDIIAERFRPVAFPPAARSGEARESRTNRAAWLPSSVRFHGRCWIVTRRSAFFCGCRPGTKHRNNTPCTVYPELRGGPNGKCGGALYGAFSGQWSVRRTLMPDSKGDSYRPWKRNRQRPRTRANDTTDWHSGRPSLWTHATVRQAAASWTALQ